MAFPTTYWMIRSSHIKTFILLFSFALLLEVIWHFNYKSVETIINAIPHQQTPYLVMPDEGPDLKRLPNLTSISWPHHNRPNFTRRSVGSGFKLKLSEGQYNSLERLLRVFEGVMISLKLQNQWFLGDGTLIGSLRHHDIVPWDDDIDLRTDLTYRKTIQSALRNLSSEFSTYVRWNHDKLYFRPTGGKENVNSSTIGSFNYSHVPWAWPYIDILYFTKTIDGTTAKIMLDSRKFNFEEIFPVIYRPFGQHWYPAPHNPISMLSTYYSPSKHLCASNRFSHANENLTSSRSVPCSSLTHLHAFVQRCPVRETGSRWRSPQLCDEHLIDGSGRSIHKIRTMLDRDEMRSPFFAVKHPTFSCP